MQYFGLLAVLLAFLGVSVWLSVDPAVLEPLRELVYAHQHLGYLAYVLLLTIAVVCMPVTIMPLIPVASELFGPFATAILSVIGWVLGAAIAFLIARHLGRPILERFFDLTPVDRIARSVPANTRFLYIVLLRLTLPVDIVSYALGLTKSVTFSEYLLATSIGVVWFSFAFAYLSDALLTRNTLILVELAAASVFVFVTACIILRRSHRYEKPSDH